MHLAYSLGGGEAEIRDQKVEVDAEIPGCGDPAAGQGMAKPLDTSLQSIHTPILALRPWGGGVESGGAGDDWRGVLTGAVVRQRLFAGIGLPCEHELQLLSTVQRSSMRLQGSLKDASVRDESATSIAHRQTRRVRCVEDQAQSSASSWPNSPWSSLFIPYRFLVEIRQFAGAFQPGPVRAQLAKVSAFPGPPALCPHGLADFSVLGAVAGPPEISPSRDQTLTTVASRPDAAIRRSISLVSPVRIAARLRNATTTSAGTSGMSPSSRRALCSAHARRTFLSAATRTAASYTKLFTSVERRAARVVPAHSAEPRPFPVGSKARAVVPTWRRHQGQVAASALHG